VTVYPTVPEVLSIHATMIERFGGSHGIRDRGGLESALARPQTGYNRDLIEEGAAYRRIIRFIDGNKRVAVTIAAAFLRVNGYRLEFDALTAFSFLIGLYEKGRMRFDELDGWLPKNVVHLRVDTQPS
jgi:death-on-curing protein